MKNYCFHCFKRGLKFIEVHFVAISILRVEMKINLKCLAVPGGNINIIMKIDQKENCQWLLFKSKEWKEEKKHNEEENQGPFFL